MFQGQGVSPGWALMLSTLYTEPESRLVYLMKHNGKGGLSAFIYTSSMGRWITRITPYMLYHGTESSSERLASG